MLLSELTALRGVSGCEDEVRAALRKEAERILGGRGRVFTDTIGNLYACRDAREPGKKRAMVCAHMDEVGMIVRGITDADVYSTMESGAIIIRMADSCFTIEEFEGMQ